MNPSLLLSLSTDYLSRIHNIKKDDIPTLREVIREHNRLYYQAESPIIGDTEYDQLFHALARAESDYYMFDESSPTAHLAILASEQFQKVAHMYPMISLDNTYGVDEVREWNGRTLRVLQGKVKSDLYPLVGGKGKVETDDTFNFQLSTFNYYIQPKYDGLGLAVVYEYGKLKQAITRGSGVEGEDVTLTAWEIENLPKQISALENTARMEIRGEVMMSRTAFDHVNRERLATSEKLFANPRNAASGSLRQLDPLVTRSRHLQFFAYAVPQVEQGSISVISTVMQRSEIERRDLVQNAEQDFSVSKITETDFLHSKGQILRYNELMDILSSWGFERVDFDFKNISGIENLCELIEQETKNRREYFDFDIDGMVLKLDDMNLWDDLGRTEHHPRYAIAYKFPAKQVRTRVISIEHSVGRTGTVTPVANLEAVDVGGVVVRRATLHNYDELIKKGVREGDQVFIMRAGEVIPEIVSVITEVRDGSEKEINIPTICPICSTKLEQDTGKVAIFCPNTHCSARIQGQLEMFVGRQAMNIDGLGPRQIEDFITQGWITDFASVFQLGRYGDQILTLEGYKEKSVQNLIDSLEKARHTTLDRMFVGLGIPNVGKKTARALAAVISTAKITDTDFLHSKGQILNTIFSLTEEDLLEVKDIGPETARSFVEYMRENREVVERLYGELEIQIPEQNPQSATGQAHSSFRKELQGKSFCVTGSFEMLSRDEIHELIERHGGEVRTSVSAKLDYLIAGDNAGSKRSKATECGVQILSIGELTILLEQTTPSATDTGVHPSRGE